MKRVISLLWLLSAFSFCNAKDIHAGMRNCIFLSSKDSAYVETELSVEARSLKFVKTGKNQFQATTEVIILYEQNNSVKNFFKYLLNSPFAKDTTAINYNLLDLKRVALPEGNYTVELILKDVNDSASKGYFREAVNIGFKKGEVALSGIELVSEYAKAKQNSTFTKNGYDIKPQTIAYYPTMLNSLSFYAEVYNTDEVFKDKDYLLTYSIKESDNKPVKGFYSYVKQQAGKSKMILSGFDISGLPTGNYVLSLEVRNDKNELVNEKSLPFRRSNKNTPFNPLALKDVIVEPTFGAAISRDSISFFMQSLRPIAGDDEVNFIIDMKKHPDTLLMEKFLYSFWKQRAPQYPLESWKKYVRQVYMAERNFKTANRHGFDTDRGRVYLQYGAPNDIADSHSEPGTLPYQIWHYYYIPPKQSNIKFVFYEQDGITNDYKLIYSDAIGEIQDPRWKYKIMDAFKESNGFGNTDNVGPTKDSFGSHVSDNFEQ